MRTRSLWALSIATAISAAAPGCGLSLDFDPPDPQAGIDASAFDAGGGALDAGARDAGPAPECERDADCDDGLFCDGPERCEAGACEPGEPPCPDASACLLRTCDEGTAACGDFVSTCEDSEICTPDGTCVPRPACETSAECPDDGDPCTGTSECVGGECAFRPAPRCGFPRGCVRDECVAFVGCREIARHDLCDELDGLSCTVPTCAGDTGLCGEVAVDTMCDDTFACTVDACSPATTGHDGAGCTHLPVHASCDDGATCTRDLCAPGAGRRDARGCVQIPDDDPCAALAGTSICAEGVCVGGRATASSGGTGCALRYDSGRCMDGQTCVWAGGSAPATCVALPMTSCTVGATCDDGDPCNGSETCVSSVCTPGAGCPDVGCEEGWCDRSGPTPVCALRPTALCPGFP